MDKIDVLKIYTNGNESKYVEEAILNNQLSYHGINISKFQNKLENYLNIKNRLLLVNSGTSSIHLALILSGVTVGDFVLCPTFTFCASVNPIIYLGAKPIFIDCELTTWGINPVHLEKAIIDCLSKGKKPKAIIYTNNYGMPAKIDDILLIAQKYNIKLIEDSASALGSLYKSKTCGNFGDFSIFSFNSNKIITTSGGGALISSNKSERDKAAKLANQSKENKNYYSHKTIGYNYRMNNVNAGIGRAQIESLNKIVVKKREINAFYYKHLNHIEGLSIVTENSTDYYSNHWLTNLVIEPEKLKFSLSQLKTKLLEKSIYTRFLWKPLHLQSAYNQSTYFGDKNSEYLFKNGLSLPSSYDITKKEQHQVIKIILNLI